MKFTKMHGLGNDFVLIEDREEKLNLTPKQISHICHRHLGVGADGLILIQPSNKCAVKMVFYNQDGSRAAMCGNGVRCFAKYVYDHGIVQETCFSIETRAGKTNVKIIEQKNADTIVQVNMGKVDYNPSNIPMNIDKKDALDEVVYINNQEIVFSSVLVGVPHSIIEVDHLETYPVERIGRALENHPLFPEKTNVNFIEIVNRKEVRGVTWERGVGLTLACGTGACAIAAVLKEKRRIDSPVRVHLPGGTLEINFAGEHILMTGPAEEVFTGNLS